MYVKNKSDVKFNLNSFVNFFIILIITYFNVLKYIKKIFKTIYF